MLRCGGSSHHFAAPRPPTRAFFQSGESSRLSAAPAQSPPLGVGKRQKKNRALFSAEHCDFARVLDGPDSLLEFVVGWGQSKV
jgi:hypothetical protein